MLMNAIYLKNLLADPPQAVPVLEVHLDDADGDLQFRGVPLRSKFTDFYLQQALSGFMFQFPRAKAFTSNFFLVLS